VRNINVVDIFELRPAGWDGTVEGVVTQIEDNERIEGKILGEIAAEAVVSDRKLAERNCGDGEVGNCSCHGVEFQTESFEHWVGDGLSRISIEAVLLHHHALEAEIGGGGRESGRNGSKKLIVRDVEGAEADQIVEVGWERSGHIISTKAENFQEGEISKIRRQ